MVSTCRLRQDHNLSSGCVFALAVLIENIGARSSGRHDQCFGHYRTARSNRVNSGLALVDLILHNRILGCRARLSRHSRRPNRTHASHPVHVMTERRRRRRPPTAAWTPHHLGDKLQQLAALSPRHACALEVVVDPHLEPQPVVLTKPATLGDRLQGLAAQSPHVVHALTVIVDWLLEQLQKPDIG